MGNLKYNNLLVSHGGFFSHLNSATSRDALCIFAEPDSIFEDVTLHLLVIDSCNEKNLGTIHYSVPRILILVGRKTALEIIEEYVSVGEGNTPQFTNSVMECYLSKKSSLLHRYVQLESSCFENYHVKSTLVEQEEESYYRCTEIKIGSSITRHDLLINQSGPKTETDVRHFVFAGEDQTHGVHSRIHLDHPLALISQLHKSI